jgi:hypothetical protein
MFRNFVVIHKDGERILMGSMLQNFLRPSFTNFHNKLECLRLQAFPAWSNNLQAVSLTLAVNFSSINYTCEPKPLLRLAF